MIIQRNGDIFKQKDIQVIITCCNCQCTMGSGIAAAIRAKYPEAYAADLKTEKGDKSKLGSYSIAKVKDPNSHLKYIVNLYGQFDFGSFPKRYVSYDAIAQGLEKLRDSMLSKKLNNLTIGLPFNMGAFRAGGDWNVIESIIFSVFEEYPFKVIICKLDNG